MSGETLSLDWETFSEVDLKAAGAYVYALHPSTDILCAAWAFGDEEPELWLPGQPVPARIVAHVQAGGVVKAWNAPFERVIWRKVATPKYGWPAIRDEQLWCSAAEGANMALPRDLDGAAAALGGEAEQKDATGKRVMMKLSRPRRPTKNDSRVRWTPEMAPDDFDTLYRYCQQDVRAERGIGKRVYALTADEREIYLLNQQMNDRGIRIDRPLIEAAQVVVEETLEDLNRQLSNVTKGLVTKASQNDRLLEWIQHRGVAADSLSKSSIAQLLADDDARPAPVAEDTPDDHVPEWAAEAVAEIGHNGGPALDGLPDDVKAALLIRQEAAKSSTAKLKRMLVAACPDDRIRGSVLYYGASRTGRESGRLHQPQNFPRGEKAVLKDLPLALNLIRRRDVNGMRLLLGNPLGVVASCLRACMVAKPGHKLVSVDFSNVEGRVLAWMAGEQWKLQAFRDYDAGTGPDLYKVAYGKSFGIAPELVDDDQRQVGKVQELACGYQGWVGAFQTFARLYGVVIPDEKAAQMAGSWREAHPRTKKLWSDLNDAALRAVVAPGRKFEAGPVTYLCRNDYLWCRLPSGRVLAYCRPTVERNDRGEDAVHYWGVPNPAKPIPKGPGNSRRWAKLSAYGGLFCENDDQAISRDLMVGAEKRLATAGYPLVLKVHDQLVAEVPVNFGSVREMAEIACAGERWSGGLPVAADGWEGDFFRK